MKYLLILILLLSGCSQKNKTSSKIEFELLYLHNVERVTQKINPLVLDQNLCKYAKDHSEKMAKSKRLYHSKMSDLQKACKKNNVGENIAFNQKTPKEVNTIWMNSFGHRENILNKKFFKVGFAKTEDYWCSVFSD